MKKLLVILFILIEISFYSCKKEVSKTDGKVLTIEREVLKENKLRYGDKNYFDKCFIVNLETNENCLLKSITQLEVYEDNIFVFDISLKSILKFDMNGKFIQKIGEKGSGPEEYVTMSSFYINSFDKTVNIIDPIKLQVTKYTLENEFVAKNKCNNKHITFASKFVEINEDDLFVYYSANWETDDMYLILNKDDLSVKHEIKKYPIKLNTQKSQMFANQPFSCIDDKIIFSSIFTDTIYSYNNDTISPCLVIKDKENISHHSLKKNFENSTKNNVYSSIMNQMLIDGKYNIGYINYFENKRYIICDYKTLPTGSMNGVLWDKSRQEGILLGGLNNTPDFNVNFNYSDKNTIVRVWKSEYAYLYKEDILKDKGILNGYPTDLYESLKDIQVDDNPILIFYQFKNQ